MELQAIGALERVRLVSLKILVPIHLKKNDKWWYCDKKHYQFCKYYLDSRNGQIKSMDNLIALTKYFLRGSGNLKRDINTLTSITSKYFNFPMGLSEVELERLSNIGRIFYACRLNKDENYTFILNNDCEPDTTCMLCVAYDISKYFKFNNDLDQIEVVHGVFKSIPKQKILRMYLEYYKRLGYIEYSRETDLVENNRLTS